MKIRFEINRFDTDNTNNGPKRIWEIVLAYQIGSITVDSAMYCWYQPPHLSIILVASLNIGNRNIYVDYTT